MDSKIEELQDDLKILKNEIKQTLVDVRDYLVTNAGNPFPSGLAQQDIPRRGAEADRPIGNTEVKIVWGLAHRNFYGLAPSPLSAIPVCQWARGLYPNYMNRRWHTVQIDPA